MQERNRHYTVSFDTCVLFDKKNRWQLSQPAFTTLRDLAKAGVLRMIIADVVLKESKDVIARLSSKILDACEVHHAAFGGDKRHTADEIASTLFADFETFCEEIEIVPTGEVKVSEILNLYWNHAAPFGKGSKRYEFPDAFALLALKEWSTVNGDVYVVSSDSDWKKACGGKLKSYGTLEELLAHILSESGEAFELSAATKALRATLEASRDELVEPICSALDVEIRYKGNPLMQRDVHVEPYVQKIRIDECRVFRLDPKQEGRPRRVAAAVEFTLTLRLDCEIENPEFISDLFSGPTIEITKFVTCPCTFHVHAGYDASREACNIVDVSTPNSFSFEFDLGWNAERWTLKEVRDAT